MFPNRLPNRLGLWARVLAASTALSAALAITGSPAHAADPGGSLIERFLRIRAPGAASVASDGTLYVRDWPDGVPQLYRIDAPAAKPGAATTKLTSFADGVSAFEISPDGTRILVTHAAGGNENFQISLLDPRADGGRGRVVPLLRNPKVRHESMGWLDDSRSFVFTANDASPSDFHVYRFDLSEDPFAAGAAPGVRTTLLAKPGSWAVGRATKDGSRLLLDNFRSASDASLFELTTATGELRDLTPAPTAGGTVSVQSLGYMPDEQGVLYVSDVEGGIARLFLRDLKTGAVSKPIAALDAFEVDGAALNRERSLLAVNTNEDGFGVPHVFRLPSFAPVALPALGPGVNAVSGIEGNTAVVTVSNARTPGVAFAFDVPADEAGASAPQARQLTFADEQGIDLQAFPLPKLVKYPSFDGKQIPAFLFLPPGHSGDHPIPFIVNYHGGPEGQSRPLFSGLIQYLLGQGFGVLQPNVRGSTGYGREFLVADDYRKRWDSVRDGVDAAAWLVREGYAEPGRIATYGGSYGGYMTMACLVEDAMRVERGEQKAPLFGAGVNVVGVVNLQTFLEKTAGYRRKLREEEYGPLSDPEFLKSVSPITHIDKVKVPVFIAHGYHDPRVPVEEAVQLALALKERGLPSQLFIAPDEGHGFAKLDARLYFGERMAAFLREAIGGGGGGGSR